MLVALIASVFVLSSLSSIIPLVTVGTEVSVVMILVLSSLGTKVSVEMILVFVSVETEVSVEITFSSGLIGICEICDIKDI